MAEPIPSRMAGLPRDHRGYPVPAGVWRDRDGKPHFTINDEQVRQGQALEDRCPICGDVLLRGRWFVGGPRSGLGGVYIDLPMHAECAHYALRACPYLAAPHYSKRLNAATVAADKFPSRMFNDPTMDPERPEVFVAIMGIGTGWIVKDELIRYVYPKRRAQIEVWRHGELRGAARYRDGPALFLEIMTNIITEGS